MGIFIQENPLTDIVRKNRTSNPSNDTNPFYVIPGAIDTLGQSVGLMDDGSMTRFLGQVAGRKVGESYNKHKVGYRTVGDIGTLFLGVGAVTKAVRAGGAIGKGVSKLGNLGKLFSSTALTDTVAVDKAVASYSKLATSIGSELGVTNLAGIEAAQALKTTARVKALTNSLKEGVAAEAFVLGAMNKSTLFGTEGMSNMDIAVWGGFGVAADVGLGQLWVGRAIKLAGRFGGEAAAARNGQYIGDGGLDFVVGQSLTNKNASASRGLLADSPSLASPIASLKTATAAKQISSVERLMSNASQISLVTPATKSFSEQAPEVATALRGVTAQNPRLVANTTAITTVDDVVTFNFTKQTAAQVAQITTPENKELIFDLTSGLDAYIVDTLGQVRPVSKSRTLYEVSDVVVEGSGAKSGRVYYATSKQANTNNNVGFSLTGKPMLGTSAIAANKMLSPVETSQVYTAMNNALVRAQTIENTAKIPPLVNPQAVTAASRHETLDYAIALTERMGGDITSVRKTLDLSAFESLEDIKFASLQAKYRQFQNMGAANHKALRAGKEAPYADEVVGNMLMLKQDSIEGTNPALQWFIDLDEAGAKTIGDSYSEAMEDFLAHYAMDAPAGVYTNLTKNPLASAEELLLVKFDARLSDRTPAFGAIYRKSSVAGTHEYNFQDIRAAGLLREKVRVDKLSEALRNDHRASVLADLDETIGKLDPLLTEQAKGAKNLTPETVSRPILPEQGQLIPTTLDHGMRHTTGSAANSSIADIAFRKMSHVSKQRLATGLVQVNKIMDKANSKSLLQYLHYHSSKQLGWRLASDKPDELGRFLLDASHDNNKLIMEQAGMSGEAIPKYLPDPTDTSFATPLVMDRLSQDALQEMMEFSRMFHSVDDILSKSLGGAGVEKFLGHTIEPQRYGQDMVFITNSAGNVVDYAFGNSLHSARKEATRRLAARQTKNGEQLGIIDRTDVQAYKEAHKEAWNSAIIDVSQSWQHTAGRKARGTRQGLIVRPEYVTSQIAAIESNMQSMASRYLATRFAGQIDNVRAMQAASGTVTTNVKGEKAYSDVYDKWIHQTTNTSNKNLGSLYATLGNKVEHFFNTTVATGLDAIDDITGNSGKLSKEMTAAAHKLAKEYGYDPVDYAIKLANRQVGRTIPTTAESLLRSASSAVMVMSLKMFEVGHAALTYSSILTTTPHAVRWYKPLKGETPEATRLRLQHMADILPDGTAIPNPTALTISTMAKKMRGDYDEVLKEATAMGYVDSAMAEYIQDLVKPSRTPTGAAIKKMIDATGKIPVHSEEYARTISFLTGYEFFSVAGKQPKHIAMAMANDLANKAIADYRPHQRGQPFKGAAGIPLAMFQTFSINYFQRLVSHVEDKAWGTVFTQLGTQAFMFGGQGLPGYDYFNETLLANWDQTRRPEDMFDMVENPTLASFLKYGFVSTLPMLAGAESGSAIFTRGAMQTPSLPLPLNYKDTPLGNTVTRLYGGISNAVQAVAAGTGGWDAAREGLIYSMPNRPLRAMLESGIQGYGTDKYGNVIDREITDFSSGLAAFTGISTARSQEKIRMLSRDAQTKLAQRNARSRLTSNLVAAYRSNGKAGLTDDQMSDVITSYMASGGSPAGIRSWFKNAYMKANYSKFDRRAIELANSGKTNAWIEFAAEADSSR